MHPAAKPKAVPAQPGILYQDKVAVLMYHDIEPVSSNNDTITPEQFGSQLDGLQKRGFHFLSLDQFRGFMKGELKVPPNSLIVTFDDGYESFYRYAYPILHKRGLSGTCFVVTGDFSRTALVYTPHMTVDEIREMITADPDMEVQAHTDSLAC